MFARYTKAKLTATLDKARKTLLSKTNDFFGTISIQTRFTQIENSVFHIEVKNCFYRLFKKDYLVHKINYLSKIEILTWL